MGQNPDEDSGTSVPSPIMQAIERVLGERKKLEEFAQERYAELTKLREHIREEQAAANAARDQGEVERLQTHVRELESLAAKHEREANELRVERDLIRDELSQA